MDVVRINSYNYRNHNRIIKYQSLMMSISINCPHTTTLSTFTCPSLGEDDSVHSVKIICTTCFDLERQSAQLVSQGALSDEHYCMDCGRNPARYNKSLMMAMCDPCRLEQGSNFLQFSFGRVGKDKGRELPNDIFEGRLFLGCQDSAANRDAFTKYGISHVLVCGNGLQRFYEDENSVRYHQLPIDDSLDQNLEIYLPSGVQFIEDAINNGGNVLVHCHAGVSRSASLVIAWIMKRMNCNYHSAYAYVKSRRSKIFPNSHFVSTLQRCWEPSCIKVVDEPPAGKPLELDSDETSDKLSLDSIAPPSVTDGLRSAMKSTAGSIRRFSSDRIDPWEAVDGKSLSHDTTTQGKDENSKMDCDEEEEGDFVLVLKSDEK